MTSSPAAERSTRALGVPWPAVLALVIDVVIVVVFAAAGRSTHEHGVAVPQVLGTAWPFLVGTGIGWVVARTWHRPLAVRVGVVVWVATWAVGMGLRAVTGAGTAVPFLVVAAIFLLLLVVWRAVAGLVVRR